MKIISKIKQNIVLRKVSLYFWDKLPHTGIRKGENINFASEIQGSRLSTIYELLKIIKPCEDVFFSNGSFGDHILHCSLLRSSVINGDKNNICIMYDESYHDLYLSYFEDLKGVQLTPLIGYINSCLDAYFINASEWLKGFFPIKPILPIYYPVIPYIVEYQHTITHVLALRGILRIDSNVKFSYPNQWNNLIKKARASARNLLDGINSDYILVSPSTNSVEGIPKEFWLNLVARLTRNRSVILNAPPNLFEERDLPEKAYLTHFEPHLILPAIAASSAYIGAASGLSNMAKIFCNTKQVLVANFMDGVEIHRMGLNSKLPAINQTMQYLDDAIVKQEIIIFSDKKLISKYIDQVCSCLDL